MKNFKKIISVILLIIMTLSCMSVYAEGNVIYVSKRGNDKTGNGSESSPYFTIEKAKEAARASSAAVIIEEGVYTVSDMVFTALDSGVSFEGVGNVVITGAKDFSGSDFTVVKNPDTLKKLRPEVWGKVYELGLGHYNTDITDVELYVDGEKMNIARYPNRGESRVTSNRYILATNPAINPDEEDEDLKEYDSIFTISDTDAVARWAAADLKDAYMVGSFAASYDWSKRSITRVANTSTDNITISGTVRNNAEFYICNLIEEVDVVGEFAYDSVANTIYAYLPENCKTASVVLKGTTDPLITIREAENVSFNNIKFDKISKQIFETKNSDGLSITNCEFNYIDSTFALNLNGKNMNISSNKAYGCSGGFLKFSGGEVTEDGFVNGEIVVADNLISNCGDEEFRSYTIVCGTNAPEYRVDSIGNTIRNNVIYNCGGTGAISPTGNDLTVIDNEVLNVARHIHDGGAIYSGRSNTKVGTVISNNYIHHLNKNLSYVGLYSDDGLAGISMTNNVLYDMYSGLLVGAGMEGNFSDNMIIDTTKALALGSRMSWVGGAYSDPEDENIVDGSNGWYAINKLGNKVLTFYGETAKALSEYPAAYEKYDYLTESLERRPFFAPWNTKLNGNIHFTNNSSSTLGTPFTHSYYADDGVTPLIASEAKYIASSGKTSAVSDGKVDELALYDGEFLNNSQITYQKSDFNDFDNQDFTLNKTISGSNISDINMNSIGLEDTSAYYEEDSFEFYPSYVDGELTIAFNKSKAASKYIITLYKDGQKVDEEEYFDDNSDTAYETSDVIPGAVYEITVEAVNLTKQKPGSSSVTKTYTVPAENDKSALIYVAGLLEKEVEKEENGVYVYDDDAVVDNMNATLESANALIADNSALKEDISYMSMNVCDALSAAQGVRNVTKATIVSCELLKTEARVKVSAEDFEPYSYVTIAVTNPKYEKGDIANNAADAVVRYTDVKRTGYGGEVEFTFNTHVNGIDMPDYYNVYLVGENGREVENTYYYGSIETSAVSFAFEDSEAAKEELINYKGKTLNVSLDVNNRMNEDIDAVVYCGIYEGNKLISLALVDDKTLSKNQVNKVAFDIEIPEDYTENSKVEVMICDGETLLKPLTVKKNITEIK